MSMDFSAARQYRSHGSGEVDRGRFRRLGTNVILEPGVLVFHPERIDIGDNVYVGHQAVLKGYHRSDLIIGPDTWIGQGCFLHAGGGLHIGRAVGIGPMVKVLTSAHRDDRRDVPVLFQDLAFAPVHIADGSDIGVGAVLLPGVHVGEGAIVGAGSIVTASVPPYEVWAGVPARRVRARR
jgi:acetyltransferase-like isoleucine patch superfamily enzyme